MAGSNGYVNALGNSGNKDSWRRFMEPLANAAGAVLDKVGGTWEFPCTVCGQANTRGMEDHLPSAKHFKTLVHKLNWMPPPPEEASAPDSGWWQRIDTPNRGVFLFNHLTGAHGFEDEMEEAMSGYGPVMDAWGGSLDDVMPQSSFKGMWSKGGAWGKQGGKGRSSPY